MKFYEEPKVSVMEFAVEDVITASGDPIEGGGGDGNVGGEIFD